MAVWRLQVNTGGTNVADYCLKNHVAAMGWSLRELTQAERSGIHTFLDYCNLARTQYKSSGCVSHSRIRNTTRTSSITLWFMTKKAVWSSGGSLSSWTLPSQMTSDSDSDTEEAGIPYGNDGHGGRRYP